MFDGGGGNTLLAGLLRILHWRSHAENPEKQAPKMTVPAFAGTVSILEDVGERS
jgi:hypothetical protein